MDVYRMPEWVQTDYDLELYHHGIKGQRWGVRRFQNPDGTLTALGRRRLEGIRTREIGIVTKRLNRQTDIYNSRKAKLEAQAKDLEAKGKTDKAKALRSNISSDGKLTISKARIDAAKKELDVIKNYSLSDFKKEAHDVRVETGKRAVGGLIANVLGNAVLIPTTGRAMIVVEIPNIEASKSARRLEMATRGEKSYVSDKARQFEAKSRKAKSDVKRKKFDERYRAQLEKDTRKYG